MPTNSDFFQNIPKNSKIQSANSYDYDEFVEAVRSL